MTASWKPSDDLDFHVVWLMVLFLPAGWAVSSVLPAPWPVVLLIVATQGVIATRAFYDRRRSGEPWLGYLVVNEAFVLLCAALLMWLSGLS